MGARSAARAGLFGMLGLLGAMTSEAQSFGQWSWDANAAVEQLRTENALDGVAINDYGLQTFRLGGGMNGFLLHPSLGSFRLALESMMIRTSGASKLQTIQWGGDVELRLFPQGSVPVVAWFGHCLFEYDGLAEKSPYFSRGVPASSTSVGARARWNGGFLEGLQLAVSRLSSEPESSDGRNQIDESESIEWSRSGTESHLRLHLDRSYREAGDTGLRIEDFTATADERNSFGSWSINASTAAMRRAFEYRDTESVTTDVVRFSAQGVRTEAEGKSLSIGYLFGYSSSSASSEVTSHSLSARYILPWASGFEVSPNAGWDLQQSGDQSLSAPAAGISASWTSSGAFDVGFSGGVSYVAYRAETGDSSSSHSLLRSLLGGSLAHGSPTSIRSTLDASWSRNDLRTIRVDENLPDLGASLLGLGTEDRLRGRVSFVHQGGSWIVSMNADALLRSGENLAGSEEFRESSYSSRGDLGFGTLRMFASAGGSSIDQTSFPAQSLRFVTAGLGWIPFNGVSIESSYRQDRRELRFGPIVDGKNLEASATVRIGAFVMTAKAYQRSEAQLDGNERTNRGLRWSISRRFSGWLPISSVPERRGTVR